MLVVCFLAHSWPICFIMLQSLQKSSKILNNIPQKKKQEFQLCDYVCGDAYFWVGDAYDSVQAQEAIPELWKSFFLFHVKEEIIKMLKLWKENQNSFRKKNKLKRETWGGYLGWGWWVSEWIALSLAFWFYHK